MGGPGGTGRIWAMRRTAQQRLDLLRGTRSIPRSGSTIGELARAVRLEASKSASATEGAASAWERCVPPAIAGLCRVGAARRGVLTITVKDAASRFVVDRWLRSGGGAILRGAGVRNVRVVGESAGGVG